MFAFLVALLLASPVQAEVQSFSDFSGGLNTRISSVLLQDNESPDLQNVVLDETGAITRRKGHSKVNSTAIGGGSSDVNSVYQLEQSDGDKYCIAFSSTNGYYSTDGCQTFTSFISTLTRNNDVNCDAYDDSLYCVNNQYAFAFDGSDDHAITSVANLDYLRVFRNRCFGAGNDTYPSRLYWSNLGTCETWTTSSDYVDIDADDGDIITAIGPPLFDLLPVYKKYSTYLLQFDSANPANRKVITVSRNTGAKNHRSIANYDNKQFFSSVGPFGGQPGIYVTDGIKVAEDSGKLRNGIDLLSNYYTNAGRKTFDTQSEWEDGNFDTRALSSKRDPGFMQSSYTLTGDTYAADFTSGTLVELDTATVSGSLQIAVSTSDTGFYTWQSTFPTPASYSTGDSTWTVTTGGFSFATVGGVNYLNGTSGSNAAYTTASNVSTATFWTLNYYSPTTICGSYGAYCWEYGFQADKPSGTSPYNGHALTIRQYTGTARALILLRYTNGSGLTVGSYSFTENFAQHTIKIVRNPTTKIDVYYDGALVITANNEPYVYPKVQTFMDSIADTGYVQGVGLIKSSYYKAAGDYTSRAFDTSISSPVWGAFSSTHTVPVGSGLVFYVQAATSSNGEWSTQAATSDTLRVQQTSKPWFRTKATFTTNYSSQTPRLDAWSMAAGATGTWTSDEVFLSNAMTSFGTFQTDQTLTGSNPTITYTMKISTQSGGAASTGTITVTPGSTIAHSTGAYVIVSGLFTIFSGTDVAKLDNITINWTEGTTAKSATMAVYKNRLHFCGNTSSGTFNDVCYVRDVRGAYTRWSGINSRFLNMVSGNLISGDSHTSSTGYLYKLYETDSDNNTAIHAYYDSKDHILGKIQNVKAIDRLYLVGSPDATVLTATVKADTGLRSAAYDINFSTGMAFKIANKVIDKSLTGNVFRMRFENNAASKPWSVLGYGLLYRDLGLMSP